MQSHLYRERPEVEARFVSMELRERRFALLCRAVLLILTVALVVAAIICALRGEPWAVTTAAGGSSTITGALAAVTGRRSD
jgi:F0F1-type ATP synthase assembly protein I